MTGAQDVGTPIEEPSTNWNAFLKNHFGPAMIWALLGVGSSHIILGPTFAGVFGLVAIWYIAFVYAVKYGAWELGIRYFYGTGKNVLEGYRELPGPKDWAVWVSLAVIIMAVILNTAAVGVGAAAFGLMVYQIDIALMYTLIVAVSTILVIGTNYSVLEKFLLSFVVLLIVMSGLAVLFGPPSMDVISATAFDFPAPTDPMFLALFAAVAGLVPTGVSSVFYLGSWSITKNRGLQQMVDRDMDPEDEEVATLMSNWLKVGLRDWKIAYAFSFLFLFFMLVLAANIFYPEPPADEDLAIRMGEILGGAFGAWSFYIVLIGAFAALWSTVIAGIDGGSRASVNLLNTLISGREFEMETWRRIIAIGFAVASAIPILLVGTLPVTLVVVLGTTLLIIEIFIYPANLYLVRTQIPEAYQPSSIHMVYYVVAIVIMVILAIIGAAGMAGVF